MRRIFVLLLTLSVLLSIPLTAYAHDVPQERNDCSIEVIVRYDGENVDGGTLTAIKVGYVDSEDGNYYFYQEMNGVRLDDIASSDAPGTQKTFYDNNKGNYDFYTQTQSVKEGKATFSGLGVGLYLIVQNKAAEGYSKLNPFLVSVPYMEDGQYCYHVTAAVKSELEREPETTPPTTTPPSTPPPNLPQTGQLNWPVPVLAAAGMAMLLLGTWLRSGRKKETEYEK